jgi:hypothetical protein
LQLQNPFRAVHAKLFHVPFQDALHAFPTFLVDAVKIPAKRAAVNPGLCHHLDLSILDPDQGLGHLQQMLGHFVPFRS